MSKITRRNFLKIFGAVAGAAVVPQLPAPVETPATTKINISQELLDDTQFFCADELMNYIEWGTGRNWKL